MGHTRFGRHSDRSLSDLAQEAILIALADSGISIDQIQSVWAGNAGAPVMTGQVGIAGQVIMRNLGLGKVPVINVENACATGSTAFQQAASMVTLGAYDVVLAVGVEKLFNSDKSLVFSVFEGCADVENPEDLDKYVLTDGGPDIGSGRKRSVFMDLYARLAREYMEQSGATESDFARVVSKNSYHGRMNPNVQFDDVVSVEDVLASQEIVTPLTLMMCSPIADGAAAAVIASGKAVKEAGLNSGVKVRSSSIFSGYDYDETTEKLLPWAAARAYEDAGVGPDDLTCVELHDASAPAELIYYEQLGLCKPGDGVRMINDGDTRLGGKIPVNTSGGLVRKGHPIGATGLSQLHELVHQLRGTAGKRQVENPRIGLAENGGGFLGSDSAALSITILESSR